MPIVISAASLEYVRMLIEADEAGVPVDPTAATGTVAFPLLGVAPVIGDWKAASWETDARFTPDRYYARALVGPTGVIVLAAGSKYDMWTKISGLTPEQPIIKATDHIVVTA